MTVALQVMEQMALPYVLAEARCPRCRKLLARNLGGCADLACVRCKLEVRFDSMGNVTVLLDKC